MYFKQIINTFFGEKNSVTEARFLPHFPTEKFSLQGFFFDKICVFSAQTKFYQNIVQSWISREEVEESFFLHYNCVHPDYLSDKILSWDIKRPSFRPTKYVIRTYVVYPFLGWNGLWGDHEFSTSKFKLLIKRKMQKHNFISCFYSTLDLLKGVTGNVW